MIEIIILIPISKDINLRYSDAIERSQAKVMGTRILYSYIYRKIRECGKLSRPLEQVNKLNAAINF